MYGLTQVKEIRNRRRSLWFSTHSLDVEQGQKYVTLTEDQTQFSVVIDLGRLDC